MDIIYEDNHLLIVNKAPGEIVQGDKTGDAQTPYKGARCQTGQCVSGRGAPP